MKTLCTSQDWRELAESGGEILRSQWRRFVEEYTPACGDMSGIIQLVRDDEGYFAHNPVTGEDADYGPLDFYNAGILARLDHPFADIRVMN